MTVQELIDILQTYPAHVQVYYAHALVRNTETIVIAGIDHVHEAIFEKEPIALLISEYETPNMN